MTQRFQVHPVNPQRRLIAQAVEIIRKGGLMIYPTDSCYAFGWHIGDRDPAERLQQIRQTGKAHNFTLACRDLSEIATYARVENWCYRLLRAHTPGPYTFVLKATREVPRRLQNPHRQTIGIRVPEHKVAHTLLELLGEPMLSCTLQWPDDDEPIGDPEEHRDELERAVDLVLDAGTCGLVPTTVLDLSGSAPMLIRQGRGDVSMLGLGEA